MAVTKKRVLVLDDEELILELVRDILELLDLRVATVADGREAVNIFKEAMAEGESFDLVLLDMSLPGELNGIDTLREIRKIDPSIKALVSSGYSADDIISNAKKYGFDGAVPKPYSISVLRDAVNKLLNT